MILTHGGGPVIFWLTNPYVGSGDTHGCVLADDLSDSGWAGDLRVAAVGAADVGALPLRAELHAHDRSATSRPDASPCSPRARASISTWKPISARLLEQDYDDYEVTFIVESTDDAAYPAIRRAMAAHPWVAARVVVAGRATDSGQKVHNLRVATEHLSRQIKYLAFVDSDARPGPQWLRALVSRLDEPGLGAVTGYRWFTPERPTLANALVYSMNCDVISLLTRSSHYLIWGGSWAIRRRCSTPSACATPGRARSATIWWPAG